MNERGLRFRSGDTELVGVLSLPEGDVSGAVLMVHPFGEERKFAHRVLTHAAWALAGRGCAVLRFDLSGSGDSFGEFRDATVSGWVKDIRTAAGVLRKESGCGEVSMVGLRLGASLAWLAASEMKDVQSVVLWEPVLSGKHYLETLWRRKLIKEMMTSGKGKSTLEAARVELEEVGFIDLDGWDVGKEMVDELSALDIGKPARPTPGRTLAVQIAFNGKVTAALGVFAEAVRNAGGSVEVVGIRERPIWDRIDIVAAEELIRTTVEWLSGVSAG